MKLRIGSRGSRLALWQAEHVRARLLQLRSADQIEIVVIQTTGDRVTDVALTQIGDKGLFTKELDHAVLEGTVDLAVHSFKDLPTRLTAGLALSSVLERADARDALVVAPAMPRTLMALPAGARVGTSSLRRRAQLLACRPDLNVVDLRGNVDTRLRRIQAADVDAALLAFAGLQRLDVADQAAQVLDAPGWLPAPAQGALGIVSRDDDPHTRSMVQPLDHAPTRIATTAERAFLAALEGGCQVPIGAWCVGADEITLYGLIAAVDGQRLVRGTRTGPAQRADELGRSLAQELLALGGGDILAELRASAPPAPALP
ncbi:MAG: hydroxymethylbilane synthase [Gemmatimonadota bacterium]